MTSKTKKITRIGVVAALYATITLVLGVYKLCTNTI